jgi:hypothetical protein
VVDLQDTYADLRTRLERLAQENAGWSVGEFQGIPYLISPPITADMAVANAVESSSIAVTQMPE